MNCLGFASCLGLPVFMGSRLFREIASLSPTNTRFVKSESEPNGVFVRNGIRGTIENSIRRSSEFRAIPPTAGALPRPEPVIRRAITTRPGPSSRRSWLRLEFRGDSCDSCVMSQSSQFRLLRSPAFLPLFATQAIGAFNDMQASLRDHMRKRTQTIAAIAHDLRTPLTRLRFRAEQAPDALRDRMVADVEEMDALIGQAMAYVRGEAQPEHRERFDLTELAEACALGFADTGEPVTFLGEIGRAHV